LQQRFGRQAVALGVLVHRPVRRQQVPQIPARPCRPGQVEVDVGVSRSALATPDAGWHRLARQPQRQGSGQDDIAARLRPSWPRHAEVSGRPCPAA
jgi:hypothetical protein